MSLFWSSILCLMPPQLYERVDKWTHEPGPILIIRNTFPTLARVRLFSALIKSENTKTYLLSCNNIKNPKTPLTLLHQSHNSFSLHYCIVFILMHLLFYFTYIKHLVLDIHSVELGTQEKEIVLQVAWRERRELFWLFPESSISTPSYPHGENLLLLQHFALGDPTKWHIA
jgi:hypothetical protein